MPWIVAQNNITAPITTIAINCNIYWSYINNITTSTTWCNTTNIYIQPYWVRQMGELEVNNREIRRSTLRQREGLPPIFAQPKEHLPKSLERSKELLLSQLNAEQRASYERDSHFEVIGGRSGYVYRIRVETHVANIWREHDRARFCAHCNDNLPHYDHILAQKLMLENDEDTFLAIANRS